MKYLIGFVFAGIALAQQSALDLTDQPELNSLSFRWTRTIGKGAFGNLSVAGANQVSFSPCPKGLNGTDILKQIRISEGIGTPETVIVTGGTCISNANSGTISFTTANSHTGAVKFQSADNGISEARSFLGPNGGTVLIPAGTHNIYSRILVPNNVRFRGVGRGATILRVPNNELSASTKWRLSGSPDVFIVYCLFSIEWESQATQIQDLTIDMNGANQPVMPNFVAVAGYSSHNAYIYNIEVKNMLPHSVNGGVGFYLSASNNTIEASRFMGAPAGCGGANGPGAIFVQGFRNKMLGNYATNMCDEVFVANGNFVTTMSNNIFEYGNSFMGSTASAFHAENSKQVNMTGNHCSGAGTGTEARPICYLAASILKSGAPTEEVTMTGNTAKDCAGGIVLGALDSEGHTAARITMTTNNVRNCYIGALLRGPIESAILSNNDIYGSTTIGVYALEEIDGNIKTLIMKGNIIDHTGTDAGNADVGVQIQGGTKAVETLILTDNFIGDTVNSTTQEVSINITGTPNVSGWNISGNTMIGWKSASILFGGTMSQSQLGPNYDGTANSGKINVFSEGAQLELGSVTKAGLVVIDMHSSGNNNDNDVRLLAQGGAATAGKGELQLQAETVTFSKYIKNNGVPFADLGTPPDGYETFCNNCTRTTPCAAGGGGAKAIRIGATWVCN